MMGFLRRVFGRSDSSTYSNEPDKSEYDADTQDMILSSVDLLEHMLAKGEDVNSERVINHFFVGEDSDIRRAVKLLEREGFLIGEREDGRLHVVERAILSMNWIEQTIPFIFKRAGEFDLGYDGWDVGQALGPGDVIFIRP